MGRPPKDRKSKVTPKFTKWQLETVARHQAQEYRRHASIMSVEGAEPDAIQQAVASAYNWSILPPVQDDEECAERLNYFFQHSAETGDLPTVEKLALALGVDRWQWWSWCNGVGCSQERTEMMKKARTIMAALDAELAEKQKISPVTYIFRAKNFYDMKDQHESVVTTINKSARDPERLFSDYEDVIDVEFEEK